MFSLLNVLGFADGEVEGDGDGDGEVNDADTGRSDSDTVDASRRPLPSKSDVTALMAALTAKDEALMAATMKYDAEISSLKSRYQRAVRAATEQSEFDSRQRAHEHVAVIMSDWANKETQWNAERADLMTRLANAESSNETLNRHVAALEQYIATIQAQYAAQTERIVQLESNAAPLPPSSPSSAAFQRRIVELESALKAKENEFASLHVTVAGKLDAVKKAIQRRDETIAQLTRQVATQHEHNAAVAEQLDAVLAPPTTRRHDAHRTSDDLYD